MQSSTVATPSATEEKKDDAPTPLTKSQQITDFMRTEFRSATEVVREFNAIMAPDTTTPVMRMPEESAAPEHKEDILPKKPYFAEQYLAHIKLLLKHHDNNRAILQRITQFCLVAIEEYDIDLEIILAAQKQLLAQRLPSHLHDYFLALKRMPEMGINQVYSVLENMAASDQQNIRRAHPFIEVQCDAIAYQDIAKAYQQSQQDADQFYTEVDACLTQAKDALKLLSTPPKLNHPKGESKSERTTRFPAQPSHSALRYHSAFSRGKPLLPEQQLTATPPKLR